MYINSCNNNIDVNFIKGLTGLAGGVGANIFTLCAEINYSNTLYSY